MKTTYLLCISLTFSFVAVARAKPLSYVGGTMAMQENDETGHTISLDYTFHADGSVRALPQAG